MENELYQEATSPTFIQLDLDKQQIQHHRKVMPEEMAEERSKHEDDADH
jgi:hypothetical protein